MEVSDQLNKELSIFDHSLRNQYGLRIIGLNFEPSYQHMNKNLHVRNYIGFNKKLKLKIAYLLIFMTVLFCFFINNFANAQEKPIHDGSIIRYRDFVFNTQWMATGVKAPHSVRNYVMGPLEQVTNWDTFAATLRVLKKSGVEAITTDVWWGLVEPQKGQFNWEYYKRYAEVVRSSGLNWLPILSFHQAGGNVGDTVNIPIPKWVWSEGTDMKFVDSNGFVNGEYIAFWAKEAYPLYESVMKSFAQNFASFDDTIAKIYLSLGPAGELRFPSYNNAAGWNYPDIGFLQSYSERAKKAYREFLRMKYQNQISKLNATWGLELASFDDTRLNPPTDGVEFFRNGINTSYGSDFLEFYQGTLEQHSKKMFEIGNTHLKNPFFSVAKFKAPLGGKIAGIHWKMNDPVYPHAAEKAAGYINYSKFMEIFFHSKVELTFTCMEMFDNNTFPMFSAPEKLVGDVLKLALDYGVRINGENALAISNNPNAYEQIRRIFSKSQLAGFTLLRLGQIVDSEGNPKSEIDGYRERIVQTRRQNFLVHTELDALEVKAKGYEVRLVGNTLNLGNNDPAKGLILTPNDQGDWTGFAELSKPEGINFHVVLYNPKTKHLISEPEDLRHLRDQSDHLFVDVFFGRIIPMGPMIPLKISDLGPSCRDFYRH